MTRSRQIVRRTPKIGRNEPCPCGSGQKFKDCHSLRRIAVASECLEQQGRLRMAKPYTVVLARKRWLRKPEVCVRFSVSCRTAEKAGELVQQRMCKDTKSKRWRLVAVFDGRQNVRCSQGHLV